MAGPLALSLAFASPVMVSESVSPPASTADTVTSAVLAGMVTGTVAAPPASRTTRLEAVPTVTHRVLPGAPATATDCAVPAFTNSPGPVSLVSPAAGPPGAHSSAGSAWVVALAATLVSTALSGPVAALARATASSVTAPLSLAAYLAHEPAFASCWPRSH